MRTLWVVSLTENGLVFSVTVGTPLVPAATDTASSALLADELLLGLEAPLDPCEPQAPASSTSGSDGGGQGSGAGHAHAATFDSSGSGIGFTITRGSVGAEPPCSGAGHMLSISRSTRASTAANGSLHSTVRCAWSFSFRCTQSTVKSRRCSCAARMKSPRSLARVVCGGSVLASKISRSLVIRVARPCRCSR